MHLKKLKELFFFLSSRRRHTRWPRDWSSDVCSSDLDRAPLHRALRLRRGGASAAATQAQSAMQGRAVAGQAQAAFEIGRASCREGGGWGVGGGRLQSGRSRYAFELRVGTGST